MATIALSGNDVVQINDRILADFADGNCAELTFPNDIANVKTGKNGNSIFGLNEQGRQCEFKLRLIRGSADDKFMNGLLATQQAGFSAFVLMIGEFIKKLGDGQGNVASDTYITAGGVFTKQVEAKMNVEGEAEQSVSMYSIKFASVARVIT
jgi:hypothetical protein